MALSPTSSRGGGTFNGGTITEPLIIDLSADLADRTALDVLQPATFGFGVRPFRFRQTDFSYLQMETTGAISTAGNNLRTAGGSLSTNGGDVLANASNGIQKHTLDPDTGIGFFGTAAQAQAAAIPNAAGGAIIDAEARTALNALLAALRVYGLLAT